MKARALFGLGGLVLTGALHATDQLEGEAERGKMLAGQCRTCHGLEGVAKIAIAPNIGGESEQYLSTQLHAFRSGEREQEMMTLVVQNLDDQDIADLAAWYAGFEPIVSLTADAAGAPEACVECHAVDGLSVNPDAPHLAGESTIYIDKQLKDFRSGKRASEVMSEIAAGLDDNAIRQAAEWYAAIDFRTVAKE